MRILISAGIVVAVVVGGTAFALGAAWLLAQIGRRYGTDDTPMGTTTVTQPVKDAHEANAIRAKAKTRTDRAADHHREGRAVDSGERATSRITMATRR
jgi:hypothetical protein